MTKETKEINNENDIESKFITVSKSKNSLIITNKKNNYYIDDFNGVWNDKFELIGAHQNDNRYL